MNPTETPDPLIRRNSPEFASYFPDSKRPSDSTLGRWMRAGTFPPPDLELSRAYKAHRQSTLDKWHRGEWKPAR